jgi:phage antirepressor YoqD-like protein
MTQFAVTDPTVVTMNSLELVAYINSQRAEGEAELAHYDFLKKVPLVLKGGEGKFSASYKSSQNKELPCYQFPKREACLMALSYSYDLQAKVFDRMTELENQLKPAFKIPTTFAGALMLAAQQAVELEKQALELEEKTAKIEQDKPKVAFADAVRKLDNSCLVREFAKVIGTGQNKFFQWLRDNKFLMVDNSPYQKWVDQGIFVVVEGTPYTDTKGEYHPCFTTRITGKGQIYLEQKFNNKD